MNKINTLPPAFYSISWKTRFVSFLPGTTSGGTMKEIQLTITKSPEGRYTCSSTGVLLLFISTWNLSLFLSSSEKFAIALTLAKERYQSNQVNALLSNVHQFTKEHTREPKKRLMPRSYLIFSFSKWFILLLMHSINSVFLTASPLIDNSPIGEVKTFRKENSFIIDTKL